MYKTIMFATDLGINSNKILKRAIKFARESESELIIAYVQPVIVPSLGGETTNVGTTTIELGNEQIKTMEEYKKIALASRIKHVELVVEDSTNVVNTLIDTIADKYDADLIVCGSSNSHGIKGFLLGSVSAGISKHAKCDVFVVKNKIED